MDIESVWIGLSGAGTIHKSIITINDQILETLIGFNTNFSKIACWSELIK